MFILWNILLTSSFLISIHSADFISTKHTSEQNGHSDRSGDKIFGRGKSETVQDSVQINQNPCPPNERRSDKEASCVCSSDGPRIDCSRPNRSQLRGKRDVPKKQPTEDGSRCHCNHRNCRTVDYCNCMRNFIICNCMCVCDSIKRFCNGMHNRFQTNRSSPTDHNRFEGPCCCRAPWYNFCCCFGSTARFHNGRKRFRAQCDCGYCEAEPEESDDAGTKTPESDPNADNLRGTKRSSSQNRKSVNTVNRCDAEDDKGKESVGTIDVKELFEFCKTRAKYANKRNEPIGRIDIDAMMEFCKLQMNDVRGTGKREDDRKVQDKRKDNGSVRKEYARNTIGFNRRQTVAPTLKTEQRKRTRVTTFRGKVLRNISRVLVGDYSSDYSLGLNSADLSSFGLKADSRVRRKVRKSIRNGRRNRGKVNEKRIPRKDSSEDSSSDSESLGLRFPVSRDEHAAESGEYNENTDSDQEESDDSDNREKRFKPAMDQIFNDMELNTSEEESESEKETAERRPIVIKRERTSKNRTRKAIKQMKRSNYYNPNNRAYGGAVNENKLKRAAFKRNRRFNQDNSVDDEFVFEQSDDLLHFSI